MKRLSTYLAILMACTVAVPSCSKMGTETGGRYITFGIGGDIDAVQSKGVLTTENLSATGNTVKVFGTRGGTTILDGVAISKNDQTGYWYPSPSQTWTENVAYVFRAYAYSGSPTVSADGKTATITEPDTYSQDGFVDYLFSDEVKVTAEKSYDHPTIDLKLAHVLPTVEFYVLKDPSMKTVNVLSLSVTGFFNKGEIKYNADGWSTTPSGTATDATYTISGKYSVGLDLNSTAAVMKIITMSQQLTEECKLTVTYEVDESVAQDGSLMNSHTESFILSNYGKTGLLHGHRAIFYLTVDTGIHLQSTIVPWVEVDYIEGTVLPTI